MKKKFFNSFPFDKKIRNQCAFYNEEKPDFLNSQCRFFNSTEMQASGFTLILFGNQLQQPDFIFNKNAFARQPNYILVCKVI